MKRGLSLRAKISVMIILLLTFALLLNVFLNYFNFEKNYTSIVYSRFFVIARDLQNTAEYGLSLGLSLPELKNLQEVINGILDEQKDIVSIAIFDDHGRIIFHTDPGEKDKAIPSKWIGSLDKESISEFTDDKSAILLPLTNAFNIRTGALALSFPKSHIEIPVKNMFSYLLEYFVISLGIFTVITFAAVSLFSQNIVRNFSGMRTFLEDSLEGKPVDLAEQGNTADLQDEIIAFRDRSMEVLRKIEDASIELRQTEAKESKSAG
jgi:hypothetical protein